MKSDHKVQISIAIIGAIVAIMVAFINAPDTIIPISTPPIIQGPVKVDSSLSSYKQKHNCIFHPIRWQVSISSGTKIIESCITRCKNTSEFGSGCSNSVCTFMCVNKWNEGDFRSDDLNYGGGLPDYSHPVFN
jgi:hypothetical protein